MTTKEITYDKELERLYGVDAATLSFSAYLTETPYFCKSIRGGRHEQGAV
jgi:hypothetical protein